MKWKTVYLRHIKYVMPHGKHVLKTAYNMDMEKCVHIHHKNMHYHIENVFCSVVKNIHVLTSQVQNMIHTIKKLFLQHVLIYIT